VGQSEKGMMDGVAIVPHFLWSGIYFSLVCAVNKTIKVNFIVC